MKLRKLLLSFLIIILGLGGSLFGCKEKLLKLSIYSDEVEVTEISLVLPYMENSDSTSKDDEENSNKSDKNKEEGESEEENSSQKTVFVKADTESEVFKQGLDISFSALGVVTCTLNQEKQTEDCFAFDIEALYPKNVTITFSTRDKKSQVTLEVKVTQDCEKIAQNFQNKNYLVLGEDKQLSNSIVEFYPSTTTNRSIEFSFSEDYYGLNITKDGLITFDEYYDQSLTEVYVNVVHKNLNETNAENYSVENIRFDVLKRVDDIVATSSVAGKDAKVTKLEFATNMGEENYNYQTIVIKRQNDENATSFEEIDDTYELYFESKNGLVNIEKSKTNNFTITISQNYRDGTDKLVVWAKNKIQPAYQSKKIEIDIVVKTYPNYISVNGFREPNEVILYDNNQSKELEIKINDCFNSDFYIDNIDSNYLTIYNRYNTQIQQKTTLKSGTVVKLLANKDISFGGESEINTAFSLVSVGRNSLFVTVNVRIIKNLTDVDILFNDNLVIDEISVSKFDLDGGNNICSFNLRAAEGTQIPTYEVEIDDENVVELVEQSSTKFDLKALTTGSTDITIKFDNGLVQTFLVKVYTPVEDFVIDFDEESKTYNVGSVDEANNLYYLKNNTTSQLIFKAIDKNGNIIYDKTIMGVSFETSTANSGHIIVSNTDNKIITLKKTETEIEVTAKILAYKYDTAKEAYEIQTIEKKFFVHVYIPINSVTLSDSYISLFTKDSLGFEDYDLSKQEISLSIFPEDASEIENISFEKNFIEAVDLSCEEIGKGSLKYQLSANSIGVNDSSTTGTITFSIQEFNIVYTKKIIVKISKAKSPEKVLVDNVRKMYDEDEENYVNYLYFNLGFDDAIDINPKVYPLDSYNLGYEAIIETKNGESDPIRFENGKVIPISVGECTLILVPKGCIKSEGIYDEKYATKIEIRVADGETIPYHISSKEDLLNLCSTEAVSEENQAEYEKRYSKNYVLTSDIDMNNVEFYPIGIYRINKRSQDKYIIKEFTGSFSGKFSIGEIENNYSISGLSIFYNYSYGSSGKFFPEEFSLMNKLNLGLFYKNSGKIQNLTIQYSSVSLALSRIATPEEEDNQSQRDAQSFAYFGGISAINSGEILSCNVKLENVNIKSFFAKTYFGGICAINSTGKVENCVVSGNANVVDGRANKTMNTNLVVVGGLVGENEINSEVKAEFDVYSLDSSIFNKNNINSTINLSGLSGENLEVLTDNSCFGGIVGLNGGTIENLSFYANILAYNNVGGVAGINNGTISGCFSAGSVYGNNLVAGLCARNVGLITKCSVMLLDDDEYIEIDKKYAKIAGKTNVGGILAQNDGTISETFISSYVKSSQNHYDMLVKSVVFKSGSANFGGIYVGDVLNSNIISNVGVDTVIIEDSANKNFANNINVLYTYNSTEKTLLIMGGDEFSGVGIKAPSKINVEINNTTLSEDTVGSFNKFIKGNYNTIVLYYYENTNGKNLNDYLRNYIFKVTYENPTVVAGFTKIESNNSYVVSVDEFGNFVVNGSGDAQIKFYSLLNKDAEFIVNVKVIKAIEKLLIYEDNSSKTLLEENRVNIEKDSSTNIYLDDALKQKDVYILYEFDDSYLDVINVNSNNQTPVKVLADDETNEEKIKNIYSTFDAQVVKGLANGNVGVKAKLYVKIGEKFVLLPHEYSFSVVVCSGIKEFNIDAQDLQLATNSNASFGAEISTDLVENTEFIIEQILLGEEEKIDEFLNVDLDVEKNPSKNLIKVNYNVSIKKGKLSEILGKTIMLKTYAIDDFSNLNFVLTYDLAKTVKENLTSEEFAALTIKEKTQIKKQIFEQKNSNYVKTILLEVKDSGIVICDMQYFADGEKIKNEKGEDIININEYESDFIKIGKVGILKINVYPKLQLASSNTFTLTYENSSNLSLSMVQVKQDSDGYSEVNSALQIKNGIVLDTRSFLNSDTEQYLYVRLLTDSPINENEEFNLKLTIGGYSYYFTKTLTSKLAQNIEISYNNAILNSNGILEGIYAKGVRNQTISVIVNKLTSFVPNPVVVNNGDNLKGENYAKILLQGEPTKVGNESVKYDFVIEGINNKKQNEDEFVDIYFYIDKVVNGKTERYISNTIRLNVVEFIINSISIENVENDYLSKPIGTSYPFKINLNTTNDSSGEVQTSIKALEEKISKTNIYNFGGNSLEIKSYDNFNVALKNGYYSIEPTKESKFSGFNVNFEYVYSTNAINTNTKEDKASHFANGLYAQSFNVNFGADFYIQTDINNPVPIYSADDFVNKMKENNNYILMNDIILQKNANVLNLENGYTPQVANFASLDGNGHKVVIKDINIDLSKVQDKFSFGLWTEISENTKITNLAVKFDLSSSQSSNTINLTNIKNLTFGTIAGVNNGLIYNCSCEKFEINSSEDILNINVTSIIDDNQTNASIGGFVGINKGVITNSRSNLKLGINKGFIGGFCYQNSGTISSCYYKNALIKNLGEDEKTSLSAGFVVKNSGIIRYSFVEGEESRVDSGRYLSNINLADYCLTCPTSVAGFVFENSGEVEDCYANLSITSQSYSGGFVFTNSGLITRCYSASLNEKENNSAHAPFIATKNVINEEAMKTQITDCFYLNINKSSVNDNLVNGLTLEQFKEEYYLSNFVFDDDSEIWKSTNNLPTLCEANNVAISSRKLYSAVENASGSIIYNYVYENGCYAGSKNNPIIISSEEEFISYFAKNNETNSQYYRLINNIDFSDYSLIPTIYYTFSGKLDGNGLKISGISISAPSDYISDNTFGKQNNAFGLFSKIEKYQSDLTPVVKNLTIEPLEVYANAVGIVGTLAGIVNNATICNVNVIGENVICQGKNIVGGIVGLAIGDSKLINLYSNISTNSNYASQSLEENYLYSASYNQGTLEGNISKVSYSGGICGVVDVNKSASNNEAIRNIVVESSKTIGKISGLAFGLIGENSGVDNVKVYLNDIAYVNATYSAGLIVGENRGYISRAETFSDNNAISYFKNNVKFIGGIVGFNNSGTIVNSISRAPVIGTNEQTISAGGICGISVGGAFSSVISLGDVYANRAIGGIIGFSARRELFANAKTELKIQNATDDIDNLFDQTIKTNNIIYIANAVAFNSYGDASIEHLKADGKYIGAIIGVAHNTSESLDGTVSLATKNSYITHNNYFKGYKLSTEVNGTIKEYVLSDFGANNADSLDVSELVQTTQEKNNMCATEIEKDANGELKIGLEIFKNWSKSTFDIPQILSENSLPTLKQTNNVNTLKLEGEGTFDSPYLLGSISGVRELQSIVASGKTNVYVSVIDNIEATGKEFNSIGDSTNKFDGVLNGGNYFINGLTYFNVDEYNHSSTFGLFGYVGANAQIMNLNISANFIINYSNSVNTTGIVCAINEGYIANCNTYGGIVCVAKNITTKVALNYVGGICGQNIGLSGTGLLNCENNALIYFALTDVENLAQSNVKLSTVYAGFICGANLNEAIINKCQNKANNNIDLNMSTGDKTLIVMNIVQNGTSVENVGQIAGFIGENSTVYGNNLGEENIQVINKR